MDDFKVDTKGFCFLCLSKTDAKLDPLLEPPRSESLSHSVHSLHNLSRYLKLDMRKVFDEEGHVPQELLEKVKGARLKVELCGECVSLNKTFLKLYRQLERIEMEVKSCLNSILGKLSVDDKSSVQLLALAKSSADDSEENFNGKLRIAEVLRKEAKQKCLSKIKDAALPRIKLRKWSLKQINKERRKKVKSVLHSHRQKISIGGGGNEVLGGNYGPSLDAVKREVQEEHQAASALFEDTGNDDHFDDNYVQSENEYMDEMTPSLNSAMTMTPSNVNEEPEAITVSNSFLGTAGSTTTLPFEKEGNFYNCKVCAKRFGCKKSWNDHYRSIHLGIKYKCNLCGMEFNIKSNYRRHHKSVHVGVKFKCLVCNKLFTQKASLANHQKISSCKMGNPQNLYDVQI